MNGFMNQAAPYPQKVMAIMNQFYTDVGKANLPVMPSLYSADMDDVNDQSIYRDLWASWSGLSITSSRVFLESIRKINDEIINLVPTKSKNDALKDPRLTCNGSVYWWSEMKFTPTVLQTTSSRMPSRLIEGQETKSSTHETQEGGAFDMPIDFLRDDNLKIIWLGKLETLNESFRLTWVYKTLNSIMTQALNHMDMKYKNMIPMDHRAFVNQTDARKNLAFAMVRTKWTGLENRLLTPFVTQKVLGEVRIILGPGSLSMNRYDNHNREYYRSADESKPSNLKEDSSIVNRSTVFGVPMYVAGIYPVDDLGRQNPLQHRLFVAERLELFPRDNIDIEKYKTKTRNIRVDDGEDKVKAEIQISAVFDKSAIFTSYDDHPTDEGRNILEKLLRYTPGDAAKRLNDQLRQPMMDLFPEQNKEDKRHVEGPFGTRYKNDYMNNYSYPSHFNAHKLFESANEVHSAIKLIKRGGKEVIIKLVDLHTNFGNKLEGATSRWDSYEDWAGTSFGPSKSAGRNYASTNDNTDEEKANGIAYWINGKPSESGSGKILPGDSDLNNLGATGDNFADLRDINNTINAILASGNAVNDEVRKTLRAKFNAKWYNGNITNESALDALILNTFIYRFYQLRANAPAPTQYISFVQALRESAPSGFIFENYGRGFANGYDFNQMITDQAPLAGIGKRGFNNVETTNTYSKRVGLSEQLPSDKHIEELLKNIPLCKPLFHFLLKNNITFPLSFLLFRTAIHNTQCVIAMLGGERTGLHIIEKAEIHYARNVDDSTIRTDAKFKSVCLIHTKENIEIAPDAFPTEYLGGYGVRLMDPQHHRDIYQSTGKPADIFVCAVPYLWKPEYHFTDIRGKMDTNIYTAPVHTKEDLMYPTANEYRGIWRWDEYVEDGHHMFSRQYYQSANERNATVFFRGSQYNCSDDSGLLFNDHVEGRTEYGSSPVESNYASLYGQHLEFGNRITGPSNATMVDNVR